MRGLVVDDKPRLPYAAIALVVLQKQTNTDAAYPGATGHVFSRQAKSGVPDWRTAGAKDHSTRAARTEIGLDALVDQFQTV